MYYFVQAGSEILMSYPSDGIFRIKQISEYPEKKKYKRGGASRRGGEAYFEFTLYM